ncbi:hypothetical protein DY000_02015817 [Brassica cretica]|uniref:DUF295 domain-containing protein n=1 Tax=Brassica cretica TaxID=69181 RepID=A0ABQ7D7Y7_BRACR|nr:hypothetical protein DY000_02015817 [Brassica cretica]
MWSTRWIGQARGVAMHATRPCGWTCGRCGVSLHGAWPCIQTGRGRGVTLHVSRSCNQPCGARGVTAHASGAMRSDTRAAIRLVSDCEERSVLVETSSRPVWTWVYLRRSRKRSDRRSRVSGQGYGQPKTVILIELMACLLLLENRSSLLMVRLIGEPLAFDCLGWDSKGLYLLVGDCNSLSNARLLTPHSLLFQVTSSELAGVAGG